MSRKLITITFFSLLLLAGATVFGIWKSGTENQSAEAAAPLTGLVGWWTMDANDVNGTNYYDKSGNGNTATSTGTVALVGGKIKQALARGATYSNPSNLSAKPISANGGKIYSYVAWIKSDATLAAASEATISQGDVGNGWVILRQSTSNDGRMRLDTSAGNSQVPGGTAALPNLLDGNWHQIVITINDNAATVSMWEDSVQTVNAAAYNAGTGINFTQNFRIGGAFVGAAIGTKTTYDDVRVYNRALSAQEVTNLYSATKITYTNSAPQATTSTAARVVGWWTMDANDTPATTTFDKSGLDNDGTTTGFYTGRPATSTPGKIKQAISFDGSNGYVSIGDQSYFSPPNNPMTITGWFKTASASDEAIIAKSTVVGTYEWGVLVNNTTANKLRWQLWTNGGANYGAVTSNTIVNDGQWHFFAATINYNVNQLIYIDGVLDNTNTTFSSGMTDTTGPVNIGRRPDNLKYFNGSIDDIRIFNYILSAQDVANLYAAAKTNYTASAPLLGLVGYWTMDANDYRSATKGLYDKSGQSHTATSINAASFVSGKVNQATSFGGSDCAIMGDVDLIQGNAMTVSAWIKGTAAIAEYTGIVTKNEVSAAWALQGDTTANKIRFFVGAYGNKAVTNNAMNDGLWHHLVGTYDASLGSANVKMFVDGVLQSTTANYTSGIIGTTDDEAIGCCSQGATHNVFYTGSIDDVRIYNRALSAAEVANLYNSSARNYK